MSLQNKIDFAIILSVKNANPNGDPLNGNQPRTDYDGLGEITDVCLKRKIRDRLQDAGYAIFVQSDERKTDEMTSLESRAKADEPIGLGKNAFDAKKTNKDKTAQAACKKWFDVRAFGQVFAFKGEKKDKSNDEEQESNQKDNTGTGVSIAIRGPVTLQSAFSLKPVNIISTQITKSVNGEEKAKKASDTMGMKHRVDNAIYVAFGAMTPQLAERTGFSNDDADAIKKLLPTLFEGDASSARPEGSMKIEKIIWWQHHSKSGQYSSASVHQTLRDYIANQDLDNISFDKTLLEEFLHGKLEGLKPEIIDGF